MAWKRGPLPPNTFHWGGVILVGEPLCKMAGFHFADFQGNHVMAYDGGGTWRRVEPHEVAAYDNSIELPLPKELLA